MLCVTYYIIHFLCHLKFKTNSIKYNENLEKNILMEGPYSYKNEDFTMVPKFGAQLGIVKWLKINKNY